MGLSYSLDAPILRFVAAGDVDFDAGMKVLEAGLAAAGDWPGVRWHLLFDIRGSAENRSSGDIRDIATHVAAYRDRLSGGCAVVVASPLYYGLGRMFGGYLEPLGFAVGVFQDVETAERWFQSPVYP